MKNLPIEMLRSFVLVYDEGGFTAAAERLGRSQPAISQQLKKLEALIERPLLERGGAVIQLTPAGSSLLDYARRILALNDEAVAQFGEPSVTGRVRLGIPSEFAISLLPKIVSRFAKAYPDVTLEVTCDLSRNLLAAEGDREGYDLVLALHDKAVGKSSEQIKTDELVWVGTERSAAALMSEERAIVPLIAAPDGCIYRRRALDKLQQVQRDSRIVYTIPDLAGIQAAIEAGLGVTVLARSTVPDRLSVLTAAGLPSLGTMAISLRQSNRDNAVQLLAEYIRAGLG